MPSPRLSRAQADALQTVAEAWGGRLAVWACGFPRRTRAALARRGLIEVSGGGTIRITQAGRDAVATPR